MAAVGDLAALSWWSSLLLLLLVAFWSNWSDGWSGWQSWMRLVGQVSPFLSQPGAMVFRTFRHLVTGFWENLNGGDVGLLESDSLWLQLVSDLNQISQLKLHYLLKKCNIFFVDGSSIHTPAPFPNIQTRMSKGQMASPKRMNFRKSSKRPPPSFLENHIADFATKLRQNCDKSA